MLLEKDYFDEADHNIQALKICHDQDKLEDRHQLLCNNIINDVLRKDLLRGFFIPI